MGLEIHARVPGNYMFDGLKSQYAEFNTFKLEFDKTAGTYTIGALPYNCILEQIIVKNSEAFDGALKVGKSGALEEYVPDAAFPKTTATPNPILIGKFVEAQTAVLLTISGCTTGAGIIWLIWRPLP